MSPSRVNRWSDTDMLNFISYYRDQDVLWNSKHEDYSYKDARETALKNISAQMAARGLNMNILDVKRKIGSIRLTYAREKLSIRKAETEGKMRKTKLFWFKSADDFLQHTPIANRHGTEMAHIKNGANKAKITKNVTSKPCNVEIDPLEFNDYEKYDNEDGEYELTSLKDEHFSSETENMETSSSTLIQKKVETKSPITGKMLSATTKIPAARRKTLAVQKTMSSLQKKPTINNRRPDLTLTQRKVSYSHMSKPTVPSNFPAKTPGNVVLLTPRAINTDIDIEDEFDVFGRSIAVQLRRLPLQRATLLQSKIQYMVSEERVAFITEQKNGKIRTIR